jgi:Protein of unknown function (DUF2934)
MLMSEREHQVREIAHRLWEQEGRPADQEKRHWATAERMFDAQERTSRAGSDAKLPAENATGTRRAARRSAKRTTAGPHSSAAH